MCDHPLGCMNLLETHANYPLFSNHTWPGATLYPLVSTSTACIASVDHLCTLQTIGQHILYPRAPSPSRISVTQYNSQRCQVFEKVTRSHRILFITPARPLSQHEFQISHALTAHSLLTAWPNPAQHLV